MDLGEKYINGLVGFMTHPIEVTQKLVLMGKTRCAVPVFQEIPSGFSWLVSILEPAKLKTNRGDRCVANPSNNLMIFAIPIITSNFTCVSVSSFICLTISPVITRQSFFPLRNSTWLEPKEHSLSRQE